MTTTKYLFERANNLAGFFSTQRASTDALNALQQWIVKPDRSYNVKLDEDEVLAVELSFLDSDHSAEPDLDTACENFGVKRKYIENQ